LEDYRMDLNKSGLRFPSGRFLSTQFFPAQRSVAVAA
jgi:hypothetical protein